MSYSAWEPNEDELTSRNYDVFYGCQSIKNDYIICRVIKQIITITVLAYINILQIKGLN